MDRGFIDKVIFIDCEIGEVVPGIIERVKATRSGLQQRAAGDQGAIAVVIVNKVSGGVSIGELAIGVGGGGIGEEVSASIAISGIAAGYVVGIGGNGISFQVRAVFANNGNFFIELIAQLLAIEAAGFTAATIKGKALVVTDGGIVRFITTRAIKTLECFEYWKAGLNVVKQFGAG